MISFFKLFAAKMWPFCRDFYNASSGQFFDAGPVVIRATKPVWLPGAAIVRIVDTLPYRLKMAKRR